MDQIYLMLLELLKTVPELQWIDMDKAQLEQERPPVAFPCALVNIEFPSTDDQGGNVQFCRTAVTLRLGFSFAGNSSNNTPEQILEQSLQYCKTVNKVYKAIQGKKFEGGKFKRKAQVLEPRSDGLTVLQMPFEVTFLDRSAA